MIKIKRKRHTKTTLSFQVVAILSMFVFLTSASGIQAACIDLADVPIETQSMGAPGMVMFVYDNSGSMAFSVMTQGETEGTFYTPSVVGDTYGYAFMFAPDYGAGNMSILQGSGDEMYWKSQWSGYNRIYYNSGVLYEPWPAWTTIKDVASTNGGTMANPTTPLSDVVRSSSTFNLSSTWATITLGGNSDLGTAIDSSGIIVDNADTSGVAEIFVDERDPGFSYTGSMARWNFLNDSQYYNGNYMTYYGDSSPLPVSATWTFDIATAGNYEVWASIPKYFTRIRNADYAITYAGGTDTVTKSMYDSRNDYQEWVLLDDYDFNAGTGAGEVTLNFTNTERQGRVSIGVDAMKLVPTFTVIADRVFTSTGGWGVSTGGSQYGSNYLWTNSPGTYTASWTANDLDSRTNYNVYVRWVAVPQRSTAVSYSLDGDTPDDFNQRLNSGEWQLLESSKRFSGSSTVTLTHTTTATGDNADTDRACADAVAFLPTVDVPSASGSTKDIVMAHYFVEGSDGKVYLVNLDGAIEYYLCNGITAADNIEATSFTEITTAEASAAGIVTGKAYAKERQNFANWFQFHRSRDLVARYALATLVSSMGNIYFGLTTIPSRDIYSIRAIKEANILNVDDTSEVLNNIYNLPTPGSGTPLKDGYVKVGKFFEGGASLVNAHDKNYFYDGGYSDADAFPYLNQANGGNCQQAFMIAMTDGMYNSNTASNILDHDSDGDTIYDGGEYADSHQGTLADISMDFYERDLKADDILTDDVPTNPYDKNNQQHVVTYALGFGVDGTIDPEQWPDCPSALPDADQDCPAWPLPVDSDPTTLDDLYHSTVNGRGLYLNAANPQELVEALMKIKADIEERLGSAAAVTTNSVQRQIGSKLYRGQYLTGKWSGDIEAFEIDEKTGHVYTSSPLWSAADLLDNKVWSDRKIYTHNGTTGIPFDFNSMTTDQKTRLANGLSYAFGTATSYAFGTVDDTDVGNLVNYLRGDVSMDKAHGGPFRSRSNILGDVVHSEAEYRNGMLYVGTNDGMMHAFNSETGEEQGAYIPNMLYSELPKLAYPQYQHQYFIDNTAFSKKVGSRSLLACPMGKGAKGLFMLDVSTPMGEATASKVGLWEYPGAGSTDADLGYTYSQAAILPTQAAGWVVITANGYDSTNGNAVLYIFDALTGSVVKKLDTGVGGCNGLSSPAIIDFDGDTLADFVYAGDLKGNMWKFDLRGAATTDWKIAYNDGTNPQPLFTAVSPTGTVQPITNKPGVMRMSVCSPGISGVIVMFGTGKYLGLSDPTDTSAQSVYGIYDWGQDWEEKAGATVADKYLGAFTVGAPRLLPNTGPSVGKDLTLVKQTLIDGAGGYRFITNNPVSYFNAETSLGDHLGWYIDLPSSGERSVRRPIITGGVYMFISNIPDESPCSAGGSSYIYQVAACSGGWPHAPQFDLNGDGKFGDDDLLEHDGVEQPPITKPPVDTILLDPTILEDMVYINKPTGDGDGDDDDKVDEDKKNIEPPGGYFWYLVE